MFTAHISRAGNTDIYKVYLVITCSTDDITFFPKSFPPHLEKYISVWLGCSGFCLTSQTQIRTLLSSLYYGDSSNMVSSFLNKQAFVPSAYLHEQAFLLKLASFHPSDLSFNVTHLEEPFLTSTSIKRTHNLLFSIFKLHCFLHST